MIDSNILKIDNLGPLEVSRETLNELEEFSKSIILRNREINLISKTTEKSIKSRHIEDSAQTIDFIDEKLNGDINVTSPTGLKTLFDLSGVNLAKTFWNELKV